MQMTKEQQFDLAVGLILSHRFEGSGDDVLPKLFSLIAEICPAAHDRIMVLAAAIKTPEFEQYGLADPGEILRTFETTADFSADVARFIRLMRKADESAVLEAKVEAATNDEFRQVARDFVEQLGLNATRDDLEAFLAER